MHEININVGLDYNLDYISYIAMVYTAWANLTEIAADVFADYFEYSLFTNQMESGIPKLDRHRYAYIIYTYDLIIGPGD